MAVDETLDEKIDPLDSKLYLPLECFMHRTPAAEYKCLYICHGDWDGEAKTCDYTSDNERFKVLICSLIFWTYDMMHNEKMVQSLHSKTCKWYTIQVMDCIAA